MLDRADEPVLIVGLDHSSFQDVGAYAVGYPGEGPELLPWLQAETQIRRDAKSLQYGNQVAWVEAERSLVEEQQESGVLARHREQAMAARAGLGRQREQAVADFEDGVLGDLAKTRSATSELQANLSKAQQRLTLARLRAPIDGTGQTRG